MLIKGYKEGSNITILDAQYNYPRRKTDSKGYENDYATVLYKDNNTGEKKIEIIENPDYQFYVVNDDVYIDTEADHMMFIEKEKVHPVSVPFNNLLKSIAEETGNLDFYYDNIKSGNRNNNRRLHTVNTIFNSDMDIRDHIRYRFGKMYKNEPMTSIKKSFFDIEVDAHGTDEFPDAENAKYPVNAVSYINHFTNQVFTLLLRNPDNPLVEEFEYRLMTTNLIEDFRQRIIKHVGGINKAKYHGIADYKYNIIFYDEEIKLIIELFNLINGYSPDFLLAWNMPYDIPYLYNRIIRLGYDPLEIMCDKSVPYKYRNVKIYIDQDHLNEPEEKGDYFFITSKTIFQDQLVHFAAKRKGQAKFTSYKLDNIANVVAKVRKTDYSHITHKISDLPYLNYEIFVLYNIIDTIAQVCIETKVKDIDYVFNKCLMNNTRYNKCHRQSVYLKNRGILEYNEYGFIASNNCNVFNPKPTEKFPGALVSNPLNNTDYSKEKMFGVAINLMRNLIDFDFKSLYPSILREFNIAPNTAIGQIIIDNQVWKDENPFGYKNYSRAGQFIEDYKSGVYIEFCARWLHLAGYREFIDDMKEYFEIINRAFIENPTKYIMPIQNTTNKSISPVIDISYKNKKSFSPIIYYPERPSFEKELEAIRSTAQMDLYDIETMARRRKEEKEEEEDFNLFSSVN